MGVRAPHALGGGQPGGRAALPAAAGARWKPGQRGSPRGDHPSRLVRWRRPTSARPSLARWTASHPALAAVGPGCARNAIRRLHRRAVRAPSRLRPSGPWWELSPRTSPDRPGVPRTREQRDHHVELLRCELPPRLPVRPYGGAPGLVGVCGVGRADAAGMRGGDAASRAEARADRLRGAPRRRRHRIPSLVWITLTSKRISTVFAKPCIAASMARSSSPGGITQSRRMQSGLPA